VTRHSPVKTFWLFFFMQVLNYGLCDASSRWVAQGNVPLSVSSAMVYALLAFFVIKRVGEARIGFALAGYVAGGGVGTWLGIVVSRAVTGK
jgi:hypothetical protein